MSKIAASVLAFIGFLVFSLPMSAQLIPHGNVFAGVSYGEFTEVVNRQSYRGWNGSAEAIPFPRFAHLGFALDASGYYRTGVTQYNALFGPRFATQIGKWRPFVHAMGGYTRVNSSGILYRAPIVAVGGGTDYKLFLKNFSWRFQGDVLRSNYASTTQWDYRGSTGIVWRF